MTISKHTALDIARKTRFDHEKGAPVFDARPEDVYASIKFMVDEIEGLESLVARYEAVVDDMPVDLEDMEAPNGAAD